MKKKIIHRDLALRNLLVAPDTNTKYLIKVGDFGLSRSLISNNNDIYKSSSETQIPIRWSAPEVLSHGIYGTKSDSWSFGIVLWELFSFGAIPYGSSMSNQQVEEEVLKGTRLSKPSKECPESIYQLMLHCWDTEPEKRPDFKVNKLKTCIVLIFDFV